MEKENYYGYDPYDTLLSPIFSIRPFNQRIVRFGAQQVCKRIPISLRQILRIPKGLNPVTLGLSIQAHAYLSQVKGNRRNYHVTEVARLFELLMGVASKGYSGVCWGYDFDWEARYTKINAYVPTAVATGIITNALYEADKIVPNELFKLAILDSCNFVLNDLNRSEDEGSICFSYSPVDSQYVLNASMKAARQLVQAHSIKPDIENLSIAKSAVDYVMRCQQVSGAWSYAMNDARTWADNYHTGYVLDCLSSYIDLANDDTYKNEFELGLSYYVNNFFEDESIPKFYDNEKYPIDSTGAAQSILSLTRFGKLDLATNVACWYIKNMQAPSGAFYFRKHKYYTDKNIFMRWSNSWMLCALSYLLEARRAETSCERTK
jgi:hypothetical protein